MAADEEGLRVCEAAGQALVSRQTICKWLRRDQQEGSKGLEVALLAPIEARRRPLRRWCDGSRSSDADLLRWTSCCYFAGMKCARTSWSS